MSDGARGPAHPWLDRLAPVVIASIALIVQQRPLGMFFGPDDFIHMEQAAGLLPPPESPLRVLSQFWYFKGMLAWVGPDPFVFHLLNLIVHAANVVLWMSVLRRAGFSRTTRYASGVIFGCFPLHYLTLLYAVHMNDLFAMSCLLVAIRLLQSGWRSGPWSAAAAFAVGLASKESILAIPAMLPMLLATPSPRDRVQRVLPLMGVAACFAVAFLLMRPLGLAPGGSTYAMSFGLATLRNLLTYAGWTLDMRNAVPDTGEALAGSARLFVPFALMIAGVLAWVLPSARRAVLRGLAWFAFAGLPVFLLSAHAYAHYLYVPAAGASLAVGGLIASLSARLPSGRNQWLRVAVVLLLVGAYAARADQLIQERVSMQLSGIALPRDIATRKTVLAGRAYVGMASTLAHTTKTAVLFSPSGEGKVFGALSGRERQRVVARPTYDALTAVLDHGRALRLLFPQLDSAFFTQDWQAIPLDAQVYWRVPDGTLVSFGTGLEARASLARALRDLGREGEARDIEKSLAPARLLMP